jgi:hypothetical protein
VGGPRSYVKATLLVMNLCVAVAELKAKYTATCEWPTTANQCVALVLHSPGACEPGKPRPVVCDYWRAWSNAKPNTQYHQLLTLKIAEHYKAKIPTLKRIKVKSDGCRYSQSPSPPHVTTSRVQSAVQRKEKLLGDWNVPYKNRFRAVARFPSEPSLLRSA